MTAQEYLEQYLNAEREIDALLEKTDRLRSKAEKITPSYGGAIGVSSNVNPDKIPRLVELIIEEEERTEKRVSELLRLQKEIQSLITHIPDNTCRNVLIMRYMSGKSFEQISAALNYSEYHVRNRLHPKALNLVKDATKCN